MRAIVRLFSVKKSEKKTKKAKNMKRSILIIVLCCAM